MGVRTIAIAAVLQIIFIGVHLHPERPPMMDPSQARDLFRVAEANRTPDGFLTREEVSDIFSVFDQDGNELLEYGVVSSDSVVMEAEFKDTWLSRDLGDEVGAGYLFSRADTDRDGSITEFPDMQRVYSYFDLNEDGKVNEVEFIIVWNSLSN